MKNKKLKYGSLASVCLLLLALLPASCIKDDYAATDKATVTVTFTTRAESGTTIVGNQLASNERMQTLRVIVAKGDKILYNEFYSEEDFDEYDNGQRYKTVTFSELVTEKEEDRTFDFYAIANEKGTGYDDWGNITVSTLNAREVTQSFSSTSLIPQTAKKTIAVEIPQEGGIQKETMQLEFVMAKVQLVIVNETGSEQTVSGISLSNVDVNNAQAPLFRSEQSILSVGNKNVTMSGMVLEGNNVYDSSAQTTYVYENRAPQSGYVFNATWNGNNQPPVDLNGIKDLSRGKELRITIHLKQNSTTQFNYEVIDWKSVEVDIPEFD